MSLSKVKFTNEIKKKEGGKGKRRRQSLNLCDKKGGSEKWKIGGARGEGGGGEVKEEDIIKKSR